MMEYFGRIVEVLTDLPPGDVIGAIAVALILALGGSWLLALGRKMGASPLASSCALMMLVSIASMAIAHGRLKLPGAGDRPGGPGTPKALAPDLLLDLVDIDGDGHMTPREAVEFVRRSDSGRKGWADAFDLAHARKPDLQAATPALPGPPRGPMHPVSFPPAGRAGDCGAADPMPVACYPPSGGASGHAPPPIVRFWPGDTASR